MNAQKILSVILIGTFVLLTIASIGSAATADRVKVGCKDLAFALITWDQLLPLVPEDDIAENEHQLNENGVEPDTYQDIIDRHINDLLNDINKCKLNDAVEEMVEDIDPELP
ncbi:MAG: hypothetical protein EHM25_15205 [Nitrosopumilales archaeon]|nr:MAG: hypothetical protein EHM25_15205 [Nitrosopumilales archaeon]